MIEISFARLITLLHSLFVRMDYIVCVYILYIYICTHQVYKGTRFFKTWLLVLASTCFLPTVYETVTCKVSHEVKVFAGFVLKPS